MTRGKRVVLREDPDFDAKDDRHMEFRLTYQGILLSSQQRRQDNQRDRRANHKHDIRRVFHRQLRELWNTSPVLKPSAPAPIIWLPEDVEENRLPSYDVETIAKQYSRYGFNFVPLVTDQMNVICGVDILFLRRGGPGGVVNSGDIDNRLKTLVDALALPTEGENYSTRESAPDEQPFYCLLEDDSLIAKMSVETDQLLEDVNDKPSEHDVRLVITVHLRPYEVHMWNLRFA